MKWFKHDTNASTDAKIRKLILRHGAEGYAVYFHCLELIAGEVTNEKIDFELEHDAEVIADNLKIKSTDTISAVDKVNNIMKYIVEQKLFEESNDRIFCFKLAKRLDSSLIKNPELNNIKKKLKNEKKREVTRKSLPDKNRLDKTRKDKNKDICDSKESPVPEKQIKSKSKKKKPEKSEEDKKLYQEIQKTCESEYGVFESYKIQGTAINHMIRKAKIRDPGNPGKIIKQVFQAFRELKAGKEQFWKSQPFLPSVINSEGIWTRLIEKINQDEKIQSGPDYSGLER